MNEAAAGTRVPIYYLEVVTGERLRADEDEATFRARVERRLWRAPVQGTMTAIELAVFRAIEDSKPAGLVTQACVTEALAYRWLDALRPTGFVARLRWTWRVARRLWRGR